jgi:hypothetical protein
VVTFKSESIDFSCVERDPPTLREQVTPPREEEEESSGILVFHQLPFEGSKPKWRRQHLLFILLLCELSLSSTATNTSLLPYG